MVSTETRYIQNDTRGRPASERASRPSCSDKTDDSSPHRLKVTGTEKELEGG